MSTPELVLIHGAQGSAAVWTAVADALKTLEPALKVLAVDLPGHGAWRDTAPLADIAGMADWLGTHLPPAEGPRFVAGHSMGSLVALEFAARQRQQTAGVALIGTAWPMPVAPALLDQARQDPANAMMLIAKWSHTPEAANRPDAEGRPLRETTLALMQAQPPATLAVDLAACNIYADGSKAARSLDCPVLVLIGGADRMTAPAAAAELAALIEGATTVTLPGIGHALMAEAPQEVAATLIGWMQGPPA